MRYARFLEWKQNVRENGIPNDSSIKSYIRGLKKIVLAEGLDLDEEFLRDGLEDLMQRYTHQAEHVRVGDPILARIELGVGVEVRDLARYKSNINKYREFCENPLNRLIET